MSLIYKAFIVIVILLGALSLGVAGLLVEQETPSAYLAARHLVFFFLLGTLLSVIASRLPDRNRRSSMAFFAPILLLGPAATALLAAAAGLLQSAAAGLRALGTSMRARAKGGDTAEEAACPSLYPCGQAKQSNAVLVHVLGIAQASIAIVCAGRVYILLGGEVGRVRLPYDLIPTLAAALCLLLIEALVGETATALEQGRPVLPTWRNDLMHTFPLEGSFAGLGLLLALLYQQSHSLLSAEQAALPLRIIFVAFVVLIPCWLLYYSYRLYLEMRQAYARTLRTLSALVEARLGSPSRDSYNPGEKTRWIAECAGAISEQMGLSPREIEQVRFAAYLLEVGKVGLPRELLTRETFISSRQRKAYTKHVEFASQILEPVEFLRPVARLIRHYQERYDGLGLPEGLRGEEIPLGARILACAEAYVEAIRAADNHSALTVEAALEQLSKARGVRFDPKVLDALIHILRQRGLLGGAVSWQVAPANASPSGGSRP